MLSYRHGYHAGNFADVHKHCLLILLLRLLTAKDAPLTYYETHAGRGLYDLQGEQAQKNREFETGVARLQRTASAPAAVLDYLDCLQLIRESHPGAYPGSPLLATHLLRANDAAALIELHSSEAPTLKALFRRDSRVAVHHRDGFEGLNALTPPATQRGMVLVDPSYEIKFEYRDLPQRLARIYQRWPGGSYLIWYPLLAAAGHQVLRRQLRESGIRKILDTWIEIAPSSEPGMYGCGALLINPPWQMQERWAEANEWLANSLASGAGHRRAVTEWLVAE